ncbi:NADH-quinone oxidoreductase subunit N [Pontibacter akesuensis]|uniref:NADH-quinone oxidoreductase subunit N n=1 Tax=Pontibacter akesuensis TaxID=388950 RepID=A0A1I7KLI3_9BACT|nr:NADH-quinone oxidoreductase subunit N [Pontibacter akesuensis]GHA77879.1 NADH-quinone oxidoreductase subunit N [Pontibacter akesuensis]SFU98295.1 NADH dehydrogenase subunit N [Pontibacter akesuensis]
MNEQAVNLSQTLDAIMGGAGMLLPEFLLAFFFLLLVTLDLFKSPALKRLLPWLALTGLFSVLVLQVLGGYTSGNGYFLNLLVKDGLARYGGMLFSAAGIFTVLMSLQHKRLEKLQEGRGEFYALVLILVLGLNLMAKSVNLLMVFLAIETVSIASYILTLTFKEEKRAMEAGLKYILYGALSAGVMLYGMSFFYGFTGTLDYTSQAFAFSLLSADGMLVTVAAILVLAGFFFKISAVPFHFWAPDVYQGASLPVVALFSTGPKMAGVLVLYRFVTNFTDAVAFADVQLLLGIAAAATLLVGNLTALWQRTPRRLLAYSSVSHAGFLLLALLAFGTDYTSSILFYLTVLLFMNFGIFLVLQVAEEQYGVQTLEGFAGLGRIQPYLGVMAVLYLLSLTGLPPLAGFMGKLLVFSNVWEAYSMSGSLLLLALLVLGILLTGVALFYYIKIPFYLFFKGNQSHGNLVISLSDKLLLALFALPLLVLFFKPDLLLNWIERLLTQT